MSVAVESVNVFVYGSLREPRIFESVCGLSFTLRPSDVREPHILPAELAMLDGYRRVSPDNVYFYAVKQPDSRIQGFVIHNVPVSAIAEIDKFEGKLYDRETVSVNTAAGAVPAQAYLASHQSMKRRFGDRFHVNLIHELWLRKRIEDFFAKHTRPGETSPDADIERRASRELLGTTERDLVISHLGHDAVSDFYLEHELSRPLPSIRKLYADHRARPFMANYLTLVVKQVLLNQFELNLQNRFRFELDRLQSSMRYYTRTISLLAALRMLNGNAAGVDIVLAGSLETLPPGGRYDLLDYVKYAISAADSIFDSRMAHSELQRIRQNLQPGLIPLGAEMELSNLGFKAVLRNTSETDPDFDGFRWFNHFTMDVLAWKLGGYVDDYSGESRLGSCGFLELAPGRLNTIGELSKPATGDPWVLSQIIREVTEFYPVKSHSLHLSFQLRRDQVGRQTVLPLSIVKCLFVLGGGAQMTDSGRLWVSRMENAEIEQNSYGQEELVFARTGKRRYQLGPAEPLEEQPVKKDVYVHQYKFIRLDPRADYEPLILALKGLGLALNPGDYLTAAQLAADGKLRRDYERLKEWSANPTPISRSTKDRFLDIVQSGLMSERHGKPYHKLHYIDWAIGAIDLQIRLFNKQLKAADKGQ